MFRIAICDDEPLICSQIENIILNYAGENNLEIETQVYATGEELSKFLDYGENFDLFFLDIEMRRTSGIEIGKKIRGEMDNQLVQIVYISENDNHCCELFEIRPMHFLHKPLNELDILKDLRLALKLNNKLSGVFVYRKGHEIFRKSIKNILYFESNNREVKMVTTEGEEIFYGKLEEVFQQVAKYHFMYIHKSYAANYFYISQFKYDQVTMANKEVLPISQSRRKAIREQQEKYEKAGLK